MMNDNRIVFRLRNFYRDKGLVPSDFHCENLSICEQTCRDAGYSFSSAREAMIGSKYHCADPRIVVVSSDPGNMKYQRNATKTIEYERDCEDCTTTSGMNKNSHWYQTLYMVYLLLNLKKKRKIDLDKVKSYFAHLNSVKCCANRPKHNEAPGVLLSNCKSFLKEELSILKPNIIVTQGIRAQRAIRDNFVEKIEDMTIYRYPNDNEDEGWKVTIFEYYHLQLTPSHRAVVLPMTHPTAPSADNREQLDKFVFLYQMLNDQLFLG